MKIIYSFPGSKTEDIGVHKLLDKYVYRNGSQLYYSEEFVNPSLEDKVSFLLWFVWIIFIKLIQHRVIPKEVAKDIILEMIGYGDINIELGD